MSEIFFCGGFIFAAACADGIRVDDIERCAELAGELDGIETANGQMVIFINVNMRIKNHFFFKFKTLLLLTTSESTPSFKRCLKQHFLKAGFLKTCCDELDQFVHNGKVNQITKFFDKSITE